MKETIVNVHPIIPMLIVAGIVLLAWWYLRRQNRLIEQEEVKGKPCQCLGTRNTRPIGRWDKCPLEGEAHTSFYVLQCDGCKGITGFPEFNFKLALEKGTVEVKKKLEEIINGKGERAWIIQLSSK